jgi:hypothetical protein
VSHAPHAADTSGYGHLFGRVAQGFPPYHVVFPYFNIAQDTPRPSLGCATSGFCPERRQTCAGRISTKWRGPRKSDAPGRPGHSPPPYLDDKIARCLCSRVSERAATPHQHHELERPCAGAMPARRRRVEEVRASFRKGGAGFPAIPRGVPVLQHCTGHSPTVVGLRHLRFLPRTWPNVCGADFHEMERPTQKWRSWPPRSLPPALLGRQDCQMSMLSRQRTSCDPTPASRAGAPVCGSDARTPPTRRGSTGIVSERVHATHTPPCRDPVLQCPARHSATIFRRAHARFLLRRGPNVCGADFHENGGAHAKWRSCPPRSFLAALLGRKQLQGPTLSREPTICAPAPATRVEEMDKDKRDVALTGDARARGHAVKPGKTVSLWADGVN